MSSDGVNKSPATTFAQAYLALSKNPEPEIMDGKAAEEGSIDVKKSGVLPHNSTSITNEKNTDGKSVANKITSTHGQGKSKAHASLVHGFTLLRLCGRLLLVALSLTLRGMDRS